VATVALKTEECGSGYDLVEQMEFLYVHVIKDRGLLIGTHPYVKVRHNSYRRCTKYLDDNQEFAKWNQVLAFPGENLESGVLEVTIINKVKDDFIGRIFLDLAKLKSKKSSEGSNWYENEEDTYADQTDFSLSNEINGFSLEPQWYELEDQHGGKLMICEIMLSTLESGRIYSHSYPFLKLPLSGVKKMGELQLVVRFTCTALQK
jgi:C2 domain